MGTKNNPGNFDCHDKAEPDEPRFTLLGRDPAAAPAIALWAAIREKLRPNDEDNAAQVKEARACAQACSDYTRTLKGRTAEADTADTAFRMLIGNERQIIEYAWMSLAQSAVLLGYLERHGILGDERQAIAERVVADAERLRNMMGVGEPDEFLTRFHEALAKGEKFDTGRENVARIAMVAASDPRVVACAFAYVLADGSTNNAVSAWPSAFYAQNLMLSLGGLLGMLSARNPPKLAEPAPEAKAPEPPVTPDVPPIAGPA